MKTVTAVYVFAACLVGCLCTTPKLIQTGSGFTVSVDGDDWFKSGTVSVRYDGAWWSSTNKMTNVLKSSPPSTATGRDTFGDYEVTTVDWEPSTTAGPRLQTLSYKYSDIPDLFAFECVFVNGLKGASVADVFNQTLSTYPSLIIEKADMERGWLTWAGNMAKELLTGVWGKDDVYSNIDGGFPLVVFNKAMSKAIVLSPLNTLMSANQMTFTDTNTKDKMVTFGPLNTIDTVPAGYRFQTVFVYGNSVLHAMKRWGELMRGYYGKEASYRQSDFSVNYLGYWTDNGACYYYNTSSKYSDYEELLNAVKTDADQSGLPYRYMQLDSWWYYKGSGGGVSQWIPRKDVFPNGIEAVVKSTGWRVHAHNRWWSPETPYAKDYSFIVEDKIALPIDPTFWDYLMSSSQLDWGLMVYEQDWLDNQFSRTKALLTDLGLGEMWLKQMGESAMRYGITIQYCMPWTRHVLQSLAIPVVTQIRVSDDYEPGNSQWIIGDTTILAHAVGLAAFKDNFRTSTSQPDCKPYGHMTEEYPALETYAAALSGGPIGPSDMIGTANKTLIMATCMKDGRLLKPTHPAMSIDNTFVQKAFGSGGPNGQLWAAFTVIDHHSWYFVLAAELTSDYSLSPQDLSPIHSIDQLIVAYQYSIATGNITKLTAPYIGDGSLKITKCDKEDFQYWAIVTFMTGTENGRFLLGELNKIIAVSETRFSNFDGDSVRVMGVAGEVVRVTLYDLVKDQVIAVDCTVGPDGSVWLIMGTSGGPPPVCSG